MRPFSYERWASSLDYELSFLVCSWPSISVSIAEYVVNTMTSSVRDFSDDSGTDEQQSHSQSEIQHHSPAIGSFQLEMSTPSTGYMMPQSHLGMGHTVAQMAYPYIDPYYGGVIAPYGGQTAIHPQMMGMHHAGVPLPTDAVEEPVYVNAKQYHGILRRRQSRAKAESKNKSIKFRKPYLHESRHLHALKRARGCGGRFLNANSKENQDDQQNVFSSNEEVQPCNDSISEIRCSGNQLNGVGSHEEARINECPDSDNLFSNSESALSKQRHPSCLDK